MVNSILFNILFVAAIANFALGQDSIACGGTFTASTEAQTLTSPNYPANYDNNLNCTWIVTPQIAGEQIEIEIQIFETESCCDAIDIKDGLSNDAEKIANIRGNSIGEKFASAFGAFQIKFTSDESVTGSGFVLRYKTVNVEPSSIEVRQALSVPDTLVPFGWPKLYMSNSMQTWIIEADPGSYACIAILYLKTEECCDSLTIRNGNSETSSLLGDLRGEKTGLLYSSSRGGSLSLRFYADATNNDSGFLLSYFMMTEDPFPYVRAPQEVALECQENLLDVTDGYGLITPPGFPTTYPDRLHCSSIIVAPTECKVRMWFSYVSTEECCDWIKIRDGRERTSRKVGKVSGEARQFYSFVSSENALRLEFDSDSKTSSRGFVAYYEVVKETPSSLVTSCGGELSANETMRFVTSPNWPDPYNETSECVWQIRTEASMKIRLIVLGFMTQNKQHNLLAFDGSSTESDSLFNLNTNVYEPLVVSSTDSFLSLSYVIPSQPTTNYGGFRAAVIAYNDN